MLPLARLALGNIQAGTSPEAIGWALLELLKRHQCEVQHFTARSSLISLDGALTATGLASRHLDSWLMTPAVCRELFVRGTTGAEMAVVAGSYDVARGSATGGSLDRLCDWLDLPRVAVLDVSRLEQCRVPTRPAADGLLLDRVAGGADFCRWQTHLESLWGIPVLGAMENLPRLADAVAALQPGTAVPHDLVHHLGNSLARHIQLGAIRRLAASRPLPDVPTEVFGCRRNNRPLTVALAYDKAFNCYFPDAFDLLEAMGATLVDFSPLVDEQLPAGADLVYIGCGHPERFAAELAENHCMTSALRNHLCAGKRVFADGGGLAYLCQSVEDAQGRCWPMVGALPALARWNSDPPACEPVELTLARPSWFGQSGSCVRGYRNSRWRLEPRGALRGLIAEPGCEHDMVGCFRAVASCVQINFATQPGFLRTFFEPLVPTEGHAVVAALR